MVLVKIIALIVAIVGVIINFRSDNIEAAAWAFSAALWTLTSILQDMFYLKKDR